MNSKYKQIEDHFISLIKSGDLEIGDQLPPETEITKKSGFSRMTINKALNHMEQQGYITRVAGRGSFVRSKSMTRMLTERMGISEYIHSMGMVPASRLLSYELMNLEHDAHHQQKLDLDDIKEVHHFIRLRSGDETPIAITEDYLSAEDVPNIDTDILNSSLYEYLDRLKVGVIANYVEIKAVKATEEQQRLLKLEDDFVLQTIENVDTVSKEKGRHRLGRFSSYYNPKMFTYRFKYPNQE
ncbi:GntR family transcriptional regulator [Lactobacillus sp. YT155]|uniref:GntR family transcriptional regulator n=1 Tax=Lactobacillus sp. YT155 TaxID=3060955 RepID=UPI00265FF670|nr:GntR family transcriptional regulator [Lactobacillus sp. YT155]MDO1605826.1 GntR family transcriptional regulator [Lactobacillus sp. YT155]